MEREPLAARAPVLVLLALATLLATPVAACVLTVNGDGNGGDVADAELTFVEARQIAEGELAALSCLTQNELDQIAGETSIPAVPGTCGTVDPRFSIVGGCGLNDADQIGFADGVGTITSVDALMTNGDSIDGRKPGGGRVTLLGDGTPGRSGLLVLRDTFSTQPQTIAIRNLVIRGFAVDGISVPDLRGTVVLTGLDVFDNGRNGIQIGTQPGSPFPDCAGIVRIGGSGAGEENFIFRNAGWGIQLNEACNSFPDVGVTVTNTHVGFADTAGLVDNGNALGGIWVFFARNVVIGGPGTGERNYIGWNDGPGIRVNNGTLDGDTSTRIEGNWIGLARDFPGSARPNADGIELAIGDDLRIGGASPGQGNVISGNAGHGVIATTSLPGSLPGMILENNVIGLNPTRTAPLPNGVSGVALTGVEGATLRGNVISGNAQQGVYVGGAASAVAFENNVIGLRGPANNTNDNAAAGNGDAGIWIDGCSACVVGPGNRIAANAVFGVRVRGDGADGTAIRGNTIGLSAGNAARPNGVGVYVEAGADDTVIGGATPADRNTISANTFEGIRITGAGTERSVVRDNRIGTDATGVADLGNGGRGVRIDGGAGSTEVTGNLVSGNGSDGISLEGATGTTKVQGNTIGLDVAGNALPNARSGIALAGGTTGALVGGGGVPNLIAGNANYGIYVADAGTRLNTLQGNRIGTDGGLGNGLAGITLRAGADTNLVDDNTITGHATAPGIEIDGAATRINTLRRNRIGLDAADVAIPNAGGVRVQNLAHDNTIGGTGASDGNIVSGNAQYGLAFSGAGGFNSVAFNLIGVAGNGATDRGNAGPGVLIESGSTDTALRDNTISGNAEGVRIQGATTINHTLVRNRIGTASTGLVAVPNDGAGIRITADATRNSLGLADSPGNANTIRFNSGAGVWIESGQDNRVRVNAISGNGGLGIDLGPAGVTPNDGAGDPDTGANALQNFPVLGNIARGGGMLSVSLALDSTANADFTLNAYRNTACDASGHGEGEAWLGAVALGTPASGVGTVSALFPLADNVPAAGFVATATATLGGVERGTSEFSACAGVAPLPDPIFANGFEPAGVGLLAAAKSSGGEELIESVPLADGRTVWRIVLRGPDAGVRPGRILTLGADRAVVVHEVRSEGARCEIVGAILCAVPELNPGAQARIEVTLSTGRGQTTLSAAIDDGTGSERRVERTATR